MLKDSRPTKSTCFTYAKTCTRTIKWTHNNQADEDPAQSANKTYSVIFPVLTHHLPLTGGKGSRDPWCDSLPFNAIHYASLSIGQ